MDQRPLVGVTTQTLHAIDGIPQALPASWVMNRRYLDALARVGAVPIMIPLFSDDPATLRAVYDRLDGVFLPGGVDMEPASYGRPREPACGRTDPPRDAAELALTRWCVADGKPVFGVCRGLQVMGVACGSTLHQDCAAARADGIKHDYYPTAGHARDFLAHTVRLEPSSRLARIYGASEIRVNSMHHQAVDRLGEGLVATGWAPDGFVEAVEGAGEGFLVGVQWHPEMLIERDAGTRALFRAFVEAADAWRAQRALLGSAG